MATQHRSVHLNIISNRAVFLEAAKGEFVVRDTKIWQPEEREVLIKVITVDLYNMQH